MLCEYVFKANWYNDYDEKNETSRAIVMAESYAEAMRKIEQRLPYLTSCEITEINEQDFVWLSEENYQKVLNTNEGLDDWSDEEKESNDDL